LPGCGGPKGADQTLLRLFSRIRENRRSNVWSAPFGPPQPGKIGHEDNPGFDRHLRRQRITTSAWRASKG